MTVDAFLIVVFIVFFLVSLSIALRKGHILFSILYTCLFVYTIFTQVGYVFYPDHAAALNVYFGREIFFDYWLFVFLSFVASFVLFMVVSASRKTVRGVEPLADDRQLGREGLFPLIIVVSYVCALLVLFVWNYDNIGYALIPNKLLAYLNYLQPLVILILYARSRWYSRSRSDRWVWSALLLAELLLFVMISVRTGQRMNPVCAAIGIITYEYLMGRHKNRPLRWTAFKNKRRLLFFGIIALATLALASRIATLRGYYPSVPLEALWQGVDDLSSDRRVLNVRQIVAQDYFAPSTLLFASIYFDWVEPGEVAKSNLLNTAMFVGYPTLAEIIGSRVASHVSRNEGYAYYLLNEGFNALGWFGILYNALMITLGLALWRSFSSSSNYRFNHFMIALMATLMIPLVRAPSFTFLKDVYLFLIPGALLFWLVLEPLPFRRQRGVPLRNFSRVRR